VKSPISSSTPTDATPARSRAKSKTTSPARRPRSEAATRELRVELSERAYDIRIGPGLLTDAASYKLLRSRVVRVVTDANVAALYLDPLLEALGLSRAEALVLPAGELQKSWANAEQVLDWLLEARLPRDGALVALGGGVIGDLAGFCAALYQRGIDFVQIPTTLLAQVDSSVGGKTAVNHARGKNMIGAFHQPRAVIADTDTLRSLPPRELAAGLAEVIKSGLLGDASLFARLERDLERLLALDAAALADAIERCCALKARIVAADERESLHGGAGPRALLNLGHTFGHAVETWTRYESWLHGEAVGLGLCMAADLSARLGWLGGAEAERVAALVQRAGLPVRPPPGMQPGDFRGLMALDKKVAGGRVRLVLLRAIGEAVVTADFDPQALEQTLAHFCTPA
jgi:3-dehydroquinate synthase